MILLTQCYDSFIFKHLVATYNLTLEDEKQKKFGGDFIETCDLYVLVVKGRGEML